MNKENMLKGFIVAAIMLAMGILIVIVSDGPKGLVSSVGTALATLGIDRAWRTFVRRNATGPVASVGSASIENETLTIYEK